MENPLKDCLTIQISEEEVNSPDFDLVNYMDMEFKKACLKKIQEFELRQFLLSRVTR